MDQTAGGDDSMFSIEILTADNITPNMLFDFHHNQIINKKYVSKNNKWEVTEIDELREWSKEKRIWLTEYFLQQIERGGSVIGAFDNDILVGFSCVDGYLLGKSATHANLTMLFVDDRFKRRGIGKALFAEICKCASKKVLINFLFQLFRLSKQLHFI